MQSLAKLIIAYIQEPQILLLRAIFPAYLVVRPHLEHLILNQVHLHNVFEAFAKGFRPLHK